MSDDSLKQVYARFAIAVSYAQMVEGNLVTLLAIRAQAEKGLDFQGYLDVCSVWSSKTMGQLIQEALRGFGPTDHLEPLLEEARRKRNYLVHRYFDDNAERLATDSCHDELLKELHEITGLLRLATEELAAVVERGHLGSGMAREEYVAALSAAQGKLMEDFRSRRGQLDNNGDA